MNKTPTPQEIEVFDFQAKRAVESGFYRYDKKRENNYEGVNLTEAQAYDIIQYGWELGVGASTILDNICPYRGGKLMGAHFVSMLSGRAGYTLIEEELSDMSCTLSIWRDDHKLGSYTMSLSDHKRENNGNVSAMWKSNPKDMLLKTVKVRLVRTYASEALGGAVYIREEMPDHVLGEGDVIDGRAKQANPTTKTTPAPPPSLPEGKIAEDKPPTLGQLVKVVFGKNIKKLMPKVYEAAIGRVDASSKDLTDDESQKLYGIFQKLVASHDEPVTFKIPAGTDITIFHEGNVDYVVFYLNGFEFATEADQAINLLEACAQAEAKVVEDAYRVFIGGEQAQHEDALVSGDDVVATFKHVEDLACAYYAV